MACFMGRFDDELHYTLRDCKAENIMKKNRYEEFHSSQEITKFIGCSVRCEWLTPIDGLKVAHS